jgi:hypothetical protein
MMSQSDSLQSARAGGNTQGETNEGDK